MKNQENTKPRQHKSIAKRIIKWTCVLIVILILLVFLLIPVFVSSQKARQVILAKLNTSLDGQADFADLSMSWWKGVKITDFTFADSTGQTAVSVRQIATKPHYGAILMGNLSFGKTIIDEPKVEINLNRSPANSSQTEAHRDTTATQSKQLGLPIKKIDLVVNNGNIKVTNRKSQTVELSQINSSVNLRPPGRKTTFDINFLAASDTTSPAKIQSTGHVTPSTNSQWQIGGISGEFLIDVNDLDLATLEPFWAMLGIEVKSKGKITASMTVAFEKGLLQEVDGIAEGSDLEITAPQLKGDRFKTQKLDARISFKSEKDLIVIEQLDVKTDWLDSSIKGVVPKTLRSLEDFLSFDSEHKLTAHIDCDLAAVLFQMPHTLGIKEGINIASGRLRADVNTFTQENKRTITAAAEISDLAGTIQSKVVRLSEPITFNAIVMSDQQKTSIEKLGIKAPFGRIDCTGTLDALKYTSNLDLGKLDAELGQFVDTGLEAIAGSFSSTGTASIGEKGFSTTGSAQLSNLSLISRKKLQVQEPIANLSYDLASAKKQQVLNINELEIKASFGTVSLKNSIVPLNKEQLAAMELNLSAQVQLEKLQDFARLFELLPDKQTIGGSCVVNATIKPQDGNLRIVVKDTSIKDLKITYADAAPFQQSPVKFECDILYNPAKKGKDAIEEVHSLKLTSPIIGIRKNTFTKTTKNGVSNLQAQFDVNYDLEALSSLLQPYLPGGLKLVGKREQLLAFSSKYPAGHVDILVSNLNTKASLGFDSAEYMGLHFGPTEVDIQIEKGLLTIAPFSTTVNNGQLNFAGQADFKQVPTLLKTPEPVHMVNRVQINDQMARKLLTYVNPIFANAVDVSGVVDFNCEKLEIPLAGANTNDIVVAGTISMEQVRLQASDLIGQILSLAGTTARGQSITIHPTKFVLQNGVLRYEDMQVDIGDNPINFQNAVIGLDKSYDMVVLLPWTLSGKTARVGRDTTGERIKLRLKTKPGEKPELDLGKLIEEQLKQRLEDELRKGLEGLFK